MVNEPVRTKGAAGSHGVSSMRSEREAGWLGAQVGQALGKQRRPSRQPTDGSRLGEANAPSQPSRPPTDRFSESRMRMRSVGGRRRQTEPESVRSGFSSSSSGEKACYREPSDRGG